MYNEHIKMSYIEEKTNSSTVNKYQLPAMFERCEMFEEQLGKDVSNFTLREAENMFRTLRFKTYDSIRLEAQYLSDYTEWCIAHGYVPDGQNHFAISEFTKEMLMSCVSRVYQQNRIVDRKTILEWCDLSLNVSDKALMLGLFEGIKGKNYCEFVHMKRGDVDLAERVVRVVGRDEPVHISEELARFLLHSAEVDEYIPYTGFGKGIEYEESDLVFKNFKNTDDSISELMKGRRIQRKLNKVLSHIGVDEFITANAIYTSGIIWMAKKEGERLGISAGDVMRTKEHRERINRQFNCNVNVGNLFIKYGEFLGE